ncbi:MAG: ATP-binding protein [Candidatus Marinimicrobia bacterium]|nr:ATP-binding protein [Candidatus Neomarinimicrobiota bacterium]
MNIVIASGKGGTGKTTLATNLASYLAQNHQVVLSDLDVEEPNSALFINGQETQQTDKFKMIPKWNGECTGCGICQDVCAYNAILQLGTNIILHAQLCHSCYACSELCPIDALPMEPVQMGVMSEIKTPVMEFIESKLNVGEEQAVPLIKETTDFIQEQYPDPVIKIYDAPPGTSCPVIEAVKTADYVILITEPTPFGLHDMSLMAGVVRDMDKPFGVVINRYGVGNDDVLDYCSKEKIDVIAKIPNERKIAETYSRGELLFEKFPAVKAALRDIEHHLFSLDPGAVS